MRSAESVAWLARSDLDSCTGLQPSTNRSASGPTGTTFTRSPGSCPCPDPRDPDLCAPLPPFPFLDLRPGGGGGGAAVVPAIAIAAGSGDGSDSPPGIIEGGWGSSPPKASSADRFRPVRPASASISAATMLTSQQDVARPTYVLQDQSHSFRHRFVRGC